MRRSRLQVRIPLSKYFLMCVLYTHNWAHSIKLCTCYIIYPYMFQSFHVELIPRATTNGYRNMQIVMFEKRMYNCCLSVKHTQSSNYLLTNKQQSSALSLTLSLYYLWCIGKDRSAREAGISFIFPWLTVHCHFDLKVPCSNLTIDKRFYLQKHILYNCFCFENYINDL
jgi:hypothetical protein